MSVVSRRRLDGGDATMEEGGAGTEMSVASVAQMTRAVEEPMDAEGAEVAEAAGRGVAVEKEPAKGGRKLRELEEVKDASKAAAAAAAVEAEEGGGAAVAAAAEAETEVAAAKATVEAASTVGERRGRGVGNGEG